MHTQTTDDLVENLSFPLTQSMTNEGDLPFGCIVSINGYDLDYGKYKERKHAPLLYGAVKDPKHHGIDVISKLEQNQLRV